MSSIIDAFTRPAELLAILNYKLIRPSAVVNPAVAADGSVKDEARYICYNLLNRTSRSFSAVIKELDDELMDPVSCAARRVRIDLGVPNAACPQVCLFYIILRALDTVCKSMAVSCTRDD